MAKHKRILYLMTTAFLTLIIFLCVSSQDDQLLSVQIGFGEKQQDISLWQNDTGQYYVFLPGYTNLQQVRIVLHTANPVRINGVLLEDEMTCGDFSEGIPYDFLYTSRGKKKQSEIIFLQSSDVAAMFVDTSSGKMEYIHAEKGNEESGKLTLYLSDGTMAYSGVIASIRGRGNITWTAFEKKPYSLTLETPADLLDLGSADKWVLLANADDPSHMRNKLVYDFAESVGLEYSPDSNWVNLYLNGEYAGLYLLSERNEVHSRRVNIEQQGSFLVSMERGDRLEAQNYPYVSTTADQYLRVHTPDEPSSDQLQKLENIWQSVENAILAEDDLDPLTGKTWMELIDLDSWARKYLIEEIFGNLDACAISQFFYCDGKDPEEKIFAGPVWDYDHAWGLETSWQLAAPNGMFANRYYVRNGMNTPWFHTLYQKQNFQDRMVALYQTEFLPKLRENMPKEIASCADHVAKAGQMDQIRWGMEEKDIHREAAYLQNFLKERIAFLNKIWIEKQPYYTVKVDNGVGGIYGHFAVFPGERMAALPVLENTETSDFLGWYVDDTGESFLAEEPIDENLSICAQWQIRPVFWLRRMIKVLPLMVLMLQFVLLLVINWRKGNLIWHNDLPWKDKIKP